MAQTNKVLLLLSFLLLNGVIAGCDSCKSEKKSEKEKEKLEAEEKALMKNIKKQLIPLEAEEKALMKKIKKQIRPEVWEETERALNDIKKLTQQKLEMRIENIKQRLQEIDKIESRDDSQTSVDSILTFILSACMLHGTNIDTPSAIVLINSIDNDINQLNSLHDQDQIAQSMTQILQKLRLDQQVQQLLQDHQTIIKVREYFPDTTKLLENFKKQAELKK